MLKVDGTELTSPKTYQVTVSDIDAESNRNAKGELLRDRVATKRKIEMEWAPLTQSEISTLLRAVSDVFFDCTFVDAQDGVMTTKMYVGDRTAPAYAYDEQSGQMKWKGLKMNFIEK